MENLILGEFEKQNSKTGEILMLRNLQYGLMKNLNPKQQDDFNSAINSLIEKGLVTYEDGTSGPACLRLTEQGFENLYQNSIDIEQIKDLVLKEFEKQNSREGDVVMMRNLNFNLIQSLNPKEKELFLPAVNGLIDNGLVTYEYGSSGIESLKLTEQGYDKLY